VALDALGVAAGLPAAVRGALDPLGPGLPLASKCALRACTSWVAASTPNPFRLVTASLIISCKHMDVGHIKRAEDGSYPVHRPEAADALVVLELVGDHLRAKLLQYPVRLGGG